MNSNVENIDEIPIVLENNSKDNNKSQNELLQVST